FLKVTHGKNLSLPFTITTVDAARPLWARNPSLDLKRFKLDDRIVVLAPKTAWPAGTEIQAVLRPGAPSKEGPLLSKLESFANWEVAKAFRVDSLWCDDKQQRPGAICPAKGYMQLEFTNAIEESTYRAQKVQIAGEEFDD